MKDYQSSIKTPAEAILTNIESKEEVSELKMHIVQQSEIIQATNRLLKRTVEKLVIAKDLLIDYPSAGVSLRDFRGLKN